MNLAEIPKKEEKKIKHTIPPHGPNGDKKKKINKITPPYIFQI